MKHWDAILFDLDGTLADTIELILTCFRHTMLAHFGKVWGEAELLAGIGRPLAVQFAAFARSDTERDAMIETYLTRQREIHDDHVRLYPGVAEALAAIEAASIPMALVTSKRHELAERALERCGIRRHFGVIITPEDVTRGKPDPEPVLAAMERLGARDAARVLFIGDSPFDIRAGNAAGVRTAAALWGPFKREALEPAAPTYWLETAGDIARLAVQGSVPAAQSFPRTGTSIS